MIGSQSFPWSGVPSSLFRSSAALPLFAMLFIVGIVGGLLVGQGVSSLESPVQIAFGLSCVIAAFGVVAYRPVLFPFAAYLFMVPFDNLLQTGAGTATKFLGIASAAIVLLVLIDRRRTLTPPAALFAWGAFLLWSLASFMWSVDPAFGMGSLMQVIQDYLLFAVFTLLRVRPEEIRALCLAVIAGGTACSLYGIYLFLVAGQSMSNGAAGEQRLNISFGSHAFINADHFAGALVFPTALAFVTALRARGWQKALVGGILMILLAGIFVSATRGSVVAVGVIFLYLLVRSRHRAQLLVLGAAGILASIPFPNVWLRFVDPTQGQAGGRYGIWAVAWEAFRPHWFAGIGSGDFRLAYGEAYLKVLQRGDFHAWAEDPHNLLVSSAVELGVVGLVLVIVAWFYQFRTVRVIPRGSSLYDLRLAVEAGTLGLFVVALTVDVMWYKYLWLGLIMAVLVRNAYLCEAHSSAPSPDIVPETPLPPSDPVTMPVFV